MATFHQVDWPTAGTKVTDGTAWCSGTKVLIPAAGTVGFSATKGLTGRSKCTF